MATSLEAYVLVNIEASSVAWQVAESVLKIEGVKTANVVTGQFDAIVFAEFSELDHLGKIVEDIHRVKGVRRTQTLLSVPSPVRAGNITAGIAEEGKTGIDNYSDR